MIRDYVQGWTTFVENVDAVTVNYNEAVDQLYIAYFGNNEVSAEIATPPPGWQEIEVYEGWVPDKGAAYWRIGGAGGPAECTMVWNVSGGQRRAIVVEYEWDGTVPVQILSGQDVSNAPGSVSPSGTPNLVLTGANTRNNFDIQGGISVDSSFNIDYSQNINDNGPTCTIASLQDVSGPVSPLWSVGQGSIRWSWIASFQNTSTPTDIRDISFNSVKDNLLASNKGALFSGSINCSVFAGHDKATMTLEDEVGPVDVTNGNVTISFTRILLDSGDPATVIIKNAAGNEIDTYNVQVD